MVVNALAGSFIKPSRPECMVQVALNSFVSLGKINGLLKNFRSSDSYSSFCIERATKRSCLLDKRTRSQTSAMIFRPKGVKTQSMPHESVADLDDDDSELCPVDCVREFKTEEEFSRFLRKSATLNALVVVDFYRTSCGSCKYIEQGFAKLCKGTADNEVPIIFLKHNVLDEYDEQTEVAENLRIRSVPLFHFYKNGVLLEAFATRDKERILEAIRRYTGSASSAASSI